ncbi:MAG: RebB family R body protein, partial [Taibaiella sp.]|nr:RebB family R body protein [Taibaiella sp.]
DTTVNDQITDSVSQTGVGVTGNVASTATGNIMLATAHAMGLAALNAVNAQQQANILAQAVTTMSVKMLLSATGMAKKAARPE